MRKQLKNLSLLFAAVTAFTLSVWASNVCVETGPHYSTWTCSREGSFIEPGTFNLTNFSLCVGVDIDLLLSGTVLSNGQRTAYVSYDCTPQYNHYESVELPYSPFLYYNPPLPRAIWKVGTNFFTAYLNGYPPDTCSIITSNLGLITVTNLPCTNMAVEVINVDFGSVPTSKVGLAATGQTTNDVWNGCGVANYPNLTAADGTVTSVGLTVTNAGGGYDNGWPDPMFAISILGGSTPIGITVTNLPPGKWDVYCYSWASTFQVIVGANNYGARLAWYVPTYLKVAWGGIVYPMVWQEWGTYVRYTNVIVPDGVPLQVMSGGTGNTVPFLSGLQIVGHWSAEDDTDGDGFSDLFEHEEGTDPVTYTPSGLARFPFDNTTTWEGAQGQLPISFNQLVGVASWSANAVEVDDANPAYLKYRDLESTGVANILCTKGTVRFWVKPTWSSTTSGGTGPQSNARLLELGGEGAGAGRWSVVLNSEGTNLHFITQTNGVSETNLTATINWPAGTWHQIGLTYDASGSTLYLDGEAVVTTGAGVTKYPNATERAAGLMVGSDKDGNNQARAQIEELETWNYILTESEVIDSDDNGIPDYWEILYFGELDIDLYGDPDGDGLSNADEILIYGTNPTVSNPAAPANPAIQYCPQ